MAIKGISLGKQNILHSRWVRLTFVVVLVERGGKGGQVAAPIARQIYQAIFLEKVAMVSLGGES